MTTNTLTVHLASGDALDVREFAIEEGLSRLFQVSLTAVSTSVDVDFEGTIGGPARFEIDRTSPVDGQTRHWNGVCAGIEQTDVEDTGVSTYSIRIVPVLWLLTQRRSYRVFQDQSELDIVLAVLDGWGIHPTLVLDAGSYPKRRMRVQYAETDFDFVSRMLEDIGVAYFFEQAGDDTVLVLVDRPNKAAARAPVQFVGQPSAGVTHEHVTAVRTRREVRPGRYTQSDVDYRKARNRPLASSATQGSAVERGLERYHHNYGSFLWKGEGGGDTPHADDRGAARTDERQGARQVQQRLEAQRVDARICAFRTNAHDLRPGRVFTIADHPRGELAAPLLVVAGTFAGSATGEWTHTCEARYTDVDYRPTLRTPKPRTLGLESATVTGPAGEEIHTDEYGRVRVHFHWDREGAADETSSCWVPVSQAWAGAGFGATCLPRVGQEVLVDFLGADPDRPMVMGRVYTATTPTPYQLPKNKMVSGIRSESYPRVKGGSGPARMGGGPIEASTGMEALAPNAAAPVTGHPRDSAAAGPWIGPPPGSPAGGGVPVVRLGGPTDTSSADATHNEILFDDTAGAERIDVHAARDYHRIVQHDSFVTVKHDDFLTVEHNKTDVIKRAYSMTAGSVSIGTGSYRLHSDSTTKMYSKGETTIESGDTIKTFSTNQTQIVSGTNIVTYSEATTLIYAKGHATIKAPLATLTETKEANYCRVSTGLAELHGKKVEVSADDSITINAETITLKAGGSTITLNKSGITLIGTVIDLNP